MKPIFIRLLMIVTPLAFTIPVNAQNAADDFNAETLVASSKKYLSAESDMEALTKFKAISGKAYARFASAFETANNISVSPFKKSVLVHCSIEGITNRILYAQNGRMLHRIRYYDHSQLPVAVQDRVMDAFPRFDICSGVIEVNVSGKRAYFVVIEDRKTWKRVKVLEEEITVYEEFEKIPGQTFKD